MRSLLAMLAVVPLCLMLALTSCTEHTGQAAKGAAGGKPAVVAPQNGQVPLAFSGGHDLDPADMDRPLPLVAGGLGVPPDVFRNAFNSIEAPKSDAPPTREAVQRNKAALVKSLAKYGVDNDLLDHVTDHYRYNPTQDALWPVTPASGYAVIEGGKVKNIVVTDGGTGFTSAPTVTIAGYPDTKLKVQVMFTKDLTKNGSVSSITVE